MEPTISEEIGSRKTLVAREAANNSVSDAKVSLYTSSKSRKATMKRLMKEIEYEYNEVVKENSRLRADLSNLQGKLSTIHPATTASDAKFADMENPPHSFTKKMGALFDNASYKFKISKQKSSKIFNAVKYYKKLLGHTDSVVDVHAYTDVGIITSSFDCTCKLWLPDSDICVLTYSGHSGSVNCSRFCPTDVTMICSCCGDGSVHIWSYKSALEHIIRSKKELISSKGNTNLDDNSSPFMEPEAETLIEKTVQIKAPLTEFKSHEAPVSSVDWIFDGKTVISSSWDHTLIIWDAEKSLPINRLYGHEEEVLFVRCHPSQGMFLSTSADCTVRLWDMRTTKRPIVNVCNGHSGEVTSATFYASNIISGGLDKQAKVWDIKNLREPSYSFKASSGITRMSMDQQGYLCMPLRNNHFKVWDVTTKSSNSCWSQREGHTKSVEASCWLETQASTKGKSLYTCSIDASVICWSVSLFPTQIKMTTHS